MPEASTLVDRAGELGLRVLVAAAVITAFAVMARLALPVVRRVLDRRRRPSYTRVFAALFRVAFVVIGCLFALTLAFPSIRVADVLAIFGIVSVAAGFAFKDTFENLLAGVLLLLRDPFKSGDQVVIAGREGTVEGVTVRETLLRGHDGRRYFVPNAKVMSDVIEVETHSAAIRQSFSLRLDPEVDLPSVRDAVRDALASVDTVRADPPPDAVLTEVVDGELEVLCRFWCGSRRSEATAARDASIEAVIRELRRRQIPMPIPEMRLSMARGRTDGR